jgi:hypothetical protein
MSSSVRNVTYSSNGGIIEIEGDENLLYFQDFEIIYENDVALHPLLMAITHRLYLGEDINTVNTEEQKKTLSEDQFNDLTCTQQFSNCCICMENKKLNIKLKCNHTFCKQCIKKWLTEKSNTCPTCRTEIN